MSKERPGSSEMLRPEEATRAVQGRVALQGAGSPRPFVVAIDGHSAAGKSTFAGRLADSLGAAVLRGDDFYRVMPEAARAALSPELGIGWYYDWQRMRDQALVPLVNGEPASFRAYDWVTAALTDQTIQVEPAGVVVIEGLFVSRPELSGLIDLAVLVQAPPAIRRARQAARADATTDWLARWEAAETLFFRTARSPESFDLVVDGSQA